MPARATCPTPPTPSSDRAPTTRSSRRAGLRVEHRVAVVPFGGGTSRRRRAVARRDGFAGFVEPRPGAARPAPRPSTTSRAPPSSSRACAARTPRRSWPSTASRSATSRSPSSSPRSAASPPPAPAARRPPATAASTTWSSACGRHPDRRRWCSAPSPATRPDPTCASCPGLRGRPRRHHRGHRPGAARRRRRRSYEAWRFAVVRRGRRRDAPARPGRDAADRAPAVRRGRDAGQPRQPDGRRRRGCHGGCLMIVGYEGTSVAARRAERRRPCWRRSAAPTSARSAAGLGAGPLPRALPARLAARRRRARRDAGDRDVLVQPRPSLRRRASPRSSRRWAREPLVLCHISHVYETGCSLYFTVATAQDDDPVAQWLAAKAAACDAMIAAGATITHHHAVGTDHKPWLAREIGPVGVAMLRGRQGRRRPDRCAQPRGAHPVSGTGRRTFPPPAPRLRAPGPAGASRECPTPAGAGCRPPTHALSSAPAT